MINQKTNILRPAHPILHDNHEQMADLEDFLHMEMRLLRCFPDSFINRYGEAILDKKSNTYLCLADADNEFHLQCKVIEFVSRSACKSIPYAKDYLNDKLHEKMLDGINEFLGTEFTPKDIMIIYTYLGNGCDHTGTIDFVESGFDMEPLNELANQDNLLGIMHDATDNDDSLKEEGEER